MGRRALDFRRRDERADWNRLVGRLARLARCLLHGEVEIQLRTDAERHGIDRLDVGGVPVGALTHRGNGRLGGANELHHGGVRQLRMVAQQPGDGVRPVAAARHRGIARPRGCLLDLDVDLGLEDLQAIVGIRLALLDFLAGELAAGDRVHALDAGRHVAVGDALHLEFMEVAEIGDLAEGQPGILDEPNGGGLGHQRYAGHGFQLLENRYFRFPVFTTAWWGWPQI